MLKTKWGERTRFKTFNSHHPTPKCQSKLQYFEYWFHYASVFCCNKLYLFWLLFGCVLFFFFLARWIPEKRLEWMWAEMITPINERWTKKVCNQIGALRWILMPFRLNAFFWYPFGFLFLLSFTVRFDVILLNEHFLSRYGRNKTKWIFIDLFFSLDRKRTIFQPYNILLILSAFTFWFIETKQKYIREIKVKKTTKNSKWNVELAISLQKVRIAIFVWEILHIKFFHFCDFSNKIPIYTIYRRKGINLCSIVYHIEKIQDEHRQCYRLDETIIGNRRFNKWHTMYRV